MGLGGLGVELERPPVARDRLFEATDHSEDSAEVVVVVSDRVVDDDGPGDEVEGAGVVAGLVGQESHEM